MQNIDYNEYLDGVRLCVLVIKHHIKYKIVKNLAYHLKGERIPSEPFPHAHSHTSCGICLHLHGCAFFGALDFLVM